MENSQTVSGQQPVSEGGKSTTTIVPDRGPLARPARIKRIQTTVMILLFLAAVINYLDRSSLSVANQTIRDDLGLSGTEIGVLLSAFSLAYGIAQLPCGLLLDRKGPRIMLGVGMFFWSVFQALAGMVQNFTQFILVRIGLGIGEAPMNPCGVKVINDWFNIRHRGMPMGFFNAASMIGLAVSPPILAAMMLAMGWRSMFITIGVMGIVLSLGWYTLYRNRKNGTLTKEELEYLDSGSVVSKKESLSFKEWAGLLKNRTMWGMMIGFSGINYTAWLYIAWLPGYLQSTYHLDLKSTGWMTAVPFLFGAAGMLLNGYVVDALVNRGMHPVKTRKVSIVGGMVLSAAFTAMVPYTNDTWTAVLLIGMALFCIHFAGTSCWGLIHSSVTSRMTASVGSIQNFASFVFASFAPILTGWILDTTGSFSMALTVCAGVTLVGALSYLFIVRDPIADV